MNKYVNFNAPSPYASQQADLERRQRLAELMQQQAMQPIETNNTSITPTQGLAKVLKSYLSAKQLANITQEEKDIETNQGKEVARYLEERNPQPTVNLPDNLIPITAPEQLFNEVPNVAPSFEKSVYTPSQFTPPDSVTTPPLQNMVGNPQRAFIDRAQSLKSLGDMPKLTPEQIRAKDTGENVSLNLRTAPTITDAQRQAIDVSAVASNNPRLSQLAQYLSQQEVAAKAASRADRKLDADDERARLAAANQELTNTRLLQSAESLRIDRALDNKRADQQIRILMGQFVQKRDDKLTENQAKSDQKILERSQRPLSNKTENALTANSDNLNLSNTFINSFDPSFGNLGVAGVGGNAKVSLLKIYGDNNPIVNWWTAYNSQANEVRNRLYGSALTKVEIEAWNKQAISPEMEPSTILQNLKNRQTIEAFGLKRKMNSLLNQGFSLERIQDTTGVNYDDVKDAQPLDLTKLIKQPNKLTPEQEKRRIELQKKKDNK